MEIINGMPVFSGQRDFGYLVGVDVATCDFVLFDRTSLGPVIGTYFGGTAIQDPGDNGQTECGDTTRNEDGTEHQIDGCSLATDPNAEATTGSPLPHLPCHIQVKLYNPANGRSITVPKVDEGPAQWTGNCIDLCRKTSSYLNGDNGPNNLRLDVRILGGAHYLSDADKALLDAAGYPLQIASA